MKFIIDGHSTDKTSKRINHKVVDVSPDYNPTLDNGITSIKEETELGQSLQELNNDSLDPNTKMSGIDMRTILHPMEVNGLLTQDTLVALKVDPAIALSFSRQKKRLNVSLSGRGREDIVRMVAGERDHQADKAGGGFKKWASGFMGMNQSK